MTLADQLQAFALAHGGKLRHGPQPAKPIAPSIGPSEKPTAPPAPTKLADPYIEFTDDYSLWCRVKRGE